MKNSKLIEGFGNNLNGNNIVNTSINSQHIHGKNFQDYPEWSNAIIFRIILNILVLLRRVKNSLGKNAWRFLIDNTV